MLGCNLKQNVNLVLKKFGVALVRARDFDNRRGFLGDVLGHKLYQNVGDIAIDYSSLNGIKLEKYKLWYIQNSPKLGAAFQHFKHTCKEKSVLDAKTRELIQMAVASISRCKHCTDSHIKKALEVGATKQELTEVLLIVSM